MYKFFKSHEFDCSHTATGGDKMDPAFVHKLDLLREKCGFPFRITSGEMQVTLARSLRPPQVQGRTVRALLPT